MKAKPKPHVGQKMFLLNVGNNARYVPQTLRPGTVTKVGRKYFAVARDESPQIQTEFHIANWREKTEYSQYWSLYVSPQELEDEKEAGELHARLRKAFSSWAPTLPLEILRKIAALLP